MVQLHSMGGCGTHMIQEMFERVGVVRLTRSVYLLQAMYLARRAPDRHVPMRDYFHLTAYDAVATIATELGIATPSIAALKDDQAIFDSFAAALRVEAGERCLVAHHYFFSHPVTVTGADGLELHWTDEDRRGLQDLLERAAATHGMTFQQAAMVRNPVDIHFSHIERFGLDVRETIRAFFQHIDSLRRRSDCSVVRYEDLCTSTGTACRAHLRSLCFSEADLDGLDLSVIHAGGIEKWMLYPVAQVNHVAADLTTEMASFGYRCEFPGAVSGLSRRLRRLAVKYASEFRAMNSIFRGDFSADAAFSRHRRSLPARIWFRIVLCVPAWRRNMERYYRTRKGAALPARPIGMVVSDMFRQRRSRRHSNQAPSR